MRGVFHKTKQKHFIAILPFANISRPKFYTVSQQNDQQPFFDAPWRTLIPLILFVRDVLYIVHLLWASKLVLFFARRQRFFATTSISQIPELYKTKYILLILKLYYKENQCLMLCCIYTIYRNYLDNTTRPRCILGRGVQRFYFFLLV
jgi:hypothetical protein